jgi:hypothetical protein
MTTNSHKDAKGLQVLNLMIPVLVHDIQTFVSILKHLCFATKDHIFYYNHALQKHKTRISKNRVRTSTASWQISRSGPVFQKTKAEPGIVSWQIFMQGSGFGKSIWRDVFYFYS